MSGSGPSGLDWAGFGDSSEPPLPPQSGPPPRHPRRRSWVIVSAVATTVAIAVCIVVLALRGGSRPVGRPPVSAAPASALALLATLPVQGKAPLTGYDRVADFGPAWLDIDRNGCDTRNDILRRDLVGVTGTRCRVLSGTLHDPYTGRDIHFDRGPVTSEAVQIDHVVALANAWQTGAQALTAAQRFDLANDPINLLAVDGPTNQAKGAGDAATWLPPNAAFRCDYVARQVAVKHAYRLWVTRSERAAMARTLERCPSLPAPTSSSATLHPPGT